MNFLKRVKTRYILHRYAIKHDQWHAATAKLWMLHGLSSVEKARLRELGTLFLHQKNIIGINMPVTEEMRVMIAAQACLPVLNLGLGLLSGWTDIILYPAAFHVSREETDSSGVVHQRKRILSGEAWLRGPVILSWENIEEDALSHNQGHNVIIHEIAHKLDMLDGSSNGMPPLHYRMPIPEWTTALSETYGQLRQSLEHHQHIGINPYAATSPAEFFAVFSEYFFCAPKILHTHFIQVYRQLRLYYRQDPLSRLQLHA